MTTVWAVMSYDPYQYQGRASVRAVYSTEAAAEAAIAALKVADADDTEVYLVDDFEVLT